MPLMITDVLLYIFAVTVFCRELTADNAVFNIFTKLTPCYYEYYYLYCDYILAEKINTDKAALKYLLHITFYIKSYFGVLNFHSTLERIKPVSINGLDEPFFSIVDFAFGGSFKSVISF